MAQKCRSQPYFKVNLLRTRDLDIRADSCISSLPLAGSLICQHLLIRLEASEFQALSVSSGRPSHGLALHRVGDRVTVLGGAKSLQNLPQKGNGNTSRYKSSLFWQNVFEY